MAIILYIKFIVQQEPHGGNVPDIATCFCQKEKSFKEHSKSIFSMQHF